MRKKILAMLLCVCMVMSLSVTAFAAYTDTDGHWAEDEIDQWTAAGVMQGDGTGNFNPNSDMTRGEAATMLARLLQLKVKGDISMFTDVPEDAWFAEAIALCVGAGIMNGTGNGLMDPNGTLSREMLFVMTARALGIKEEVSTDKVFADSDEISGWAAGYMNALINAGYVNGVGNDTLAPGEDINRASVMSLLSQTIVVYATEPGTYEVPENGVVLILADDVAINGAADMTVVVAKEGAEVSLEGATGEVEVSVIANDVAVNNAPAGTTITTGEAVTGTTANGSAVAKDDEVVVEEAKPEVPSTPSTPSVPSHTHSYGNWEFDATHHWKACTCGDKIELGKHIPDLSSQPANPGNSPSTTGGANNTPSTTGGANNTPSTTGGTTPGTTPGGSLASGYTCAVCGYAAGSAPDSTT